MLTQHVVKLSFPILYLQAVLSLRIYKPSDRVAKELVNNLIDVLKNVDTGNSGYKIIEANLETAAYNQKSKNPRNFRGKSVIIKRIIPHEYRGQPFEYDPEVNTLYKPLVRLHVKKPRKYEKKILQKQNGGYNVLGYVVAVKEGTKNPKFGSRPRLNSIKTLYNKKDETPLIFKNILRGNHSEKSHLEAIEILIDKSKEMIDNLHPGNVPMFDDSVEKPNVTSSLPEYHFWDYWTYSKPIYQDDCPGNLIKLGTVCISPTGH